MNQDLDLETDCCRPIVGLTFRHEPRPSDAQAVGELLEDTGVFTAEEVGVGVSLVRERLERGLESGYYFLFADSNDGLVGFGCYGPIGCAPARFDIYWIAVSPAFHGRGIGKELLRSCEANIRRLNGVRAYVETSSRDEYIPARALYERSGYIVDALQKDFYATGDHKVTLVKVLSQPEI
ncbi:MAG: N-acetyltransferase family protein [Desulfovibrio sp.]